MAVSLVQRLVALGRINDAVAAIKAAGCPAGLVAAALHAGARTGADATAVEALLSVVQPGAGADADGALPVAVVEAGYGRAAHAARLQGGTSGSPKAVWIPSDRCAAGHAPSCVQGGPRSPRRCSRRGSPQRPRRPTATCTSGSRSSTSCTRWAHCAIQPAPRRSCSSTQSCPPRPSMYAVFAVVGATNAVVFTV